MCGRFTLRTPQNLLVEKLGLEVKPRYNIAPTQRVLVMRGGARELIPMRWGFVSPNAAQPLINARSETVSTKPTFRDAFRQRRCLVPADGFYEWKRDGGRRQPYFIQMRDGGLFAFAGLWEGAAGHESFTVLTTAANVLLAPLHDRMPVIIDATDYDRWLDPGTPPAELQALLRAHPSEQMVAHVVGPHVNSPAHDDPRCAEPRRPDPLLF